MHGESKPKICSKVQGPKFRTIEDVSRIPDLDGEAFKTPVGHNIPTHGDDSDRDTNADLNGEQANAQTRCSVDVPIQQRL